MNKEDYKGMMSEIKASEKFKKILEDEMKNAEQDTGLVENKRIINYLVLKTLAAAIIVISIIVVLIVNIIKNKNINPYDMQKPDFTVSISTSTATPRVTDNKLPKLAMVKFRASEVGLGERYLWYSIDESKNENPWTPDMKIDRLPVYKNRFVELYSQEYYYGISDNGLTDKQMKEIAENLINSIGTKINNSHIQEGDSEDNYELRNYEFECDEVLLIIWCNGTVWINGVSKLPSEYSFDYKGGTIRLGFNKKILPSDYIITDATNYNQISNAYDYLINQYNKFINMKKPVTDIIYNRTYFNKCWYDTKVFDKSGDIINQIINYNFNNIKYMGSNEYQENDFLYREQYDISEKLGDYPIISAEEAEQLLIDFKYLSRETKKFPGKQYIAKTELIYLTESYFEVFMPYYKFYVDFTDIESHNDDGIDKNVKTYAVYYVPAIQEEYLNNF